MRLIIIIVLTFGLMACSHTRDPKPVTVYEGIKFKLQTPSSFGDAMTLTQNVEIRFEDKTYELLFVTEINSEKIVIVGILPSGIRVFSVSYDGNSIISDGYGGLVESIAPEFFLADFQMAQWPLMVLEQSLELNTECFISGQCVLSESVDGLHRSMEKSGTPVFSIRYSQLPRYTGTIEFQNYQRGYDLKVTTMRVERP